MYKVIPITYHKKVLFIHTYEFETILTMHRKDFAMYKEHEYYLKRCIEISKHSREGGNTPFGAILVDADGNILLEQENVEISSKKCTGHAACRACVCII